MADKPLKRPTGKLGVRVLLGLSLAVAVYLVLALWGGWESIAAHLQSYPLKWLWVALGLSTFNFLVRYVRYHMLLGIAGVRVSVPRNLLIHFAGLALTMTPGKVGEAIKSWFLYREGHPPAKTLPTVFMERLTDLLAVLFLASVGVLVYGNGVLVFSLSMLLMGVALFLFFTPLGVRWLKGTARLLPPLRKREAELDTFFSMVRSYSKPRPLVLSLLVGVVGWGAEAFAFAFIARGAGIDLSFLEATFIYSLSTLAGVVFPGGLGGMEGMMGLLLSGKGPTGAIVAVIFLIRLATLWWATLTGFIALAAATVRYGNQE